MLLILMLCLTTVSAASNELSPCKFDYEVNAQANHLLLTCECKGLLAECLLNQLVSVAINQLEPLVYHSQVLMATLNSENNETAKHGKNYNITRASFDGSGLQAILQLRSDIPPDDVRNMKFQCILSGDGRNSLLPEQFFLDLEIPLKDYYTTTPATTQELTTVAALGQSQSEVAGMTKTNFIYLVCGVGAGVIALTVFIAVVCVRTRRRRKQARRRDYSMYDLSQTRPTPLSTPPQQHENQHGNAGSTMAIPWEGLGQLLRGILSPMAPSNDTGRRGNRLSRLWNGSFSRNSMESSEAYARQCCPSHRGADGHPRTLDRHRHDHGPATPPVARGGWRREDAESLTSSNYDLVRPDGRHGHVPRGPRPAAPAEPPPSHPPPSPPQRHLWRPPADPCAAPPGGDDPAGRAAFPGLDPQQAVGETLRGGRGCGEEGGTGVAPAGREDVLHHGLLCPATEAAAAAMQWSHNRLSMQPHLSTFDR